MTGYKAWYRAVWLTWPDDHYLVLRGNHKVIYHLHSHTWRFKGRWLKKKCMQTQAHKCTHQQCHPPPWPHSFVPWAQEKVSSLRKWRQCHRPLRSCPGRYRDGPWTGWTDPQEPPRSITRSPSTSSAHKEKVYRKWGNKSFRIHFSIEQLQYITRFSPWPGSFYGVLSWIYHVATHLWYLCLV